MKKFSILRFLFAVTFGLALVLTAGLRNGYARTARIFADGQIPFVYGDPAEPPVPLCALLISNDFCPAWCNGTLTYAGGGEPVECDGYVTGGPGWTTGCAGFDQNGNPWPAGCCSCGSQNPWCDDLGGTTCDHDCAISCNDSIDDFGHCEMCCDFGQYGNNAGGTEVLVSWCEEIVYQGNTVWYCAPAYSCPPWS